MQRSIDRIRAFSFEAANPRRATARLW